MPISHRADPAADERDAVAASSEVPELDDKIWFQKTVSAVIEPGRCVGCGGCIAACPSQSLTVAADGKPTLVRMCTGCSACWDYCPLAGLRSERVAGLESAPAAGVGPVGAAYSAQSRAGWERGQDGGVVTAVLAELLESGFIDGAVVSRRLDAFRAETVVATTTDELLASAGSVYSQSNTLAILNKPLPPGVERLALVGTPCQINVLRALQRFPWKYRQSAAANVVLAIGLFCTRSFDPFLLMREFAARGENLAKIRKVDIRDGKLFVYGESGGRSLGPVKEFHGAALSGCDECADFSGNAADLAVGNVGSEPGWSTVLVRTDAGREAWDAALPSLTSAPIEDLSGVESLQARNRKRAGRSLKRELDPDGPMWISYTEHLDAYEGTDRAPESPPAHRSHHYDVSC